MLHHSESFQCYANLVHCIFVQSEEWFVDVFFQFASLLLAQLKLAKWETIISCKNWCEWTVVTNIKTFFTFKT